jgi:hypothetical protein
MARAYEKIKELGRAAACFANVGTTGSVSIKLHGALRTSDPLPLKSQADRPLFQEGQVDLFKFSYEELGDLHSVTVSKLGGRADDGWKLDSVYIEVLGGWPERTKKAYTFECDAWFTPEVVVRTLKLSSVRPRCVLAEIALSPSRQAVKSFLLSASFVQDAHHRAHRECKECWNERKRLGAFGRN